MEYNDAPRNVIKAIPGIKLTEITASGNMAGAAERAVE